VDKHFGRCSDAIETGHISIWPRSCRGPLCVSRRSATMPQTCLFTTRSDADAGRPIDGSIFDKQQSKCGLTRPIMTIKRIGQDFVHRPLDERAVDRWRPSYRSAEGWPSLPGCFTCHCLRRLAIFQIDNMRECANPIGYDHDTKPSAAIIGALHLEPVRDVCVSYA
jgi:hypothetical protein